MTSIPDSLRLLYETTLEEDGDRYVVSIPDELAESLSEEETYRVALLSRAEPPSTPASAETREAETAEPATDGQSSGQARQPEVGGRTRAPPVEEGDVRTVNIDTLGDQGDGIAKVERGFILIVPGTKPGDRVEVEVTDVKDTVAFAETVGEATVR